MIESRVMETEVPKKEKSKMATKVTSKQMENLLGKRVLFLCANYFYEGKLERVENNHVVLSDAGIVYETGSWDSKNYSDIQKLHSVEWNVKLDSVESFGLGK